MDCCLMENEMTEVTQITSAQQLKLDLLTAVSNDAAAFDKAVAFVGVDALKFELFKKCYEQAHLQPTAVAKADEAITEAKQRLALIEA